MTNYRDNAPEFFKDLTSDGILSYFEDERTSENEMNWIKNILTSEEYMLRDNPITKWNWNKIKSVFAKEYFPNIAPENKKKPFTTEDRIKGLFLTHGHYENMIYIVICRVSLDSAMIHM